ncbi:diphthine methyltransferase [Thrips palmi]|uniref:methylated diphthine methylhydrolase n=1 Tax=Thrips palmi TaxID=161013 RepID=A0A6P8Z0L1_THRPL|nr:diphthine methyltransferase [Thrips palmi]
MTTAKFTTVFDWDTIQSADSTEWCPLAPNQNVFVCGTYQIEKKEGEGNDPSSPPTHRLGRIYVFEVSDTLALKPHQVLDLPAVLDLKWSLQKICGKTLLGVVTATAALLILELQEDKQLVKLFETEVKGPNDIKETLALSLDWSCGRSSVDAFGDNQVYITVSDSQGGANLFKISENMDLTLLKRWQGHEYEAWICAFNYWEPSVVFSGGDDCVLKGWDIRTGLDTPIFLNRSHNAGVTSLQSNALFENILVSGSYDEQLRMWDTRKMKNPLHLLNLSGGVWRVKWDPFSHNSILAACMHGGFHVVKCKDTLNSSGEPTILASYNNHASIAYGADWCHLDSPSVKMLFASDEGALQPTLEYDHNLTLVSTCSFYDHKLCVSVLSEKQT